MTVTLQTSNLFASDEEEDTRSFADIVEYWKGLSKNAPKNKKTLEDFSRNNPTLIQLPKTNTTAPWHIAAAMEMKVNNVVHKSSTKPGVVPVDFTEYLEYHLRMKKEQEQQITVDDVEELFGLADDDAPKRSGSVKRFFKKIFN
ncbi:hypothetical protein RMCBS344292_07556 [Rhizopus microsporus]|nr:hypothetical protein RMCBS344292_07556 [Rhizopus microsporus]